MQGDHCCLRSVLARNLGSLGAAGPFAAPNGVACPCEGSGTAAEVPSAVKASLKGTPDWAAEASGVGGFVAAAPEPKKDHSQCPPRLTQVHLLLQGTSQWTVLQQLLQQLRQRLCSCCPHWELLKQS